MFVPLDCSVFVFSEFWDPIRAKPSCIWWPLVCYVLWKPGVLGTPAGTWHVGRKLATLSVSDLLRTYLVPSWSTLRLIYFHSQGHGAAKKKNKFRQAWSEYEGASGSSMYPKGDLDRKQPTKKIMRFIRKSHMFSGRDKNGDSKHIRNVEKTMCFSTIISKTIEKPCVFFFFDEIIQFGRGWLFGLGRWGQ